MSEWAGSKVGFSSLALIFGGIFSSYCIAGYNHFRTPEVSSYAGSSKLN